MMKYVFFVVASMLLAITSSFPRVKRQAFDLPDGAEELLGPIKTGFNCQGLNYGYYADLENNCKIFHVCYPQELADGKQIINHYSYFCGNQTVFNQATLTCAFPEEAIPCASSPEFYYVNNNIGFEDALFLVDEDVKKANDLIVGRGSR